MGERQKKLLQVTNMKGLGEISPKHPLILFTHLCNSKGFTSTPIQSPPVQHCSSLQVNFYHSLSLKLMLFTEAFNSMQVLTLI